jgi:hypothetical protein
MELPNNMVPEASMTRYAGLSEWMETVSRQMPHLSRAQATGLALWSFGMVLTRCCGITTVSHLLAELLVVKPETMRQRLRDFYLGAADKAGAQRRELEVSQSFAPLLRWVLAWWPPDEPRLALALDATTLKLRFTVLALSVLYRGCAIPVAWVVLPGALPGSWQEHWEALLAHVQAAVPQEWTVLVLADRGLYAPWLFARIVACGWHPFLRINAQGTYRTLTDPSYRPLAGVVARDGAGWAQEVICFKRKQLRCTLVARWESSYSDPWLIVTDLAPAQADVCWYGLRASIECGFKDTKRGGWQWQQSKMEDATRAARLWLAIAVATLWVLSVGGEADASVSVSGFAALPLLPSGRLLRPSRRAQPRLLSCFRHGLNRILVSLLRGEALPLGRLVPEPWPTLTPSHRQRTSRDATDSRAA